MFLCKVVEWGKSPVLILCYKTLQSFNNIPDIIFFLTYVLYVKPCYCILLRKSYGIIALSFINEDSEFQFN